MPVMEKQNSNHFILVHGSGQGAWCWFKLINLLHKAGHRATALDLGGSGINPKKLEDIHSFHDYCKPLMDFMEALPQEERVILVGHSYGGLVISLAMERFPNKIFVAVFVTAYMPHFISPPGFIIQKFFRSVSVESVMDCQFTFGQDSETPISGVFGSKYMTKKLYKYCSEEELELAKLLVRPFKFFFEDLSKESLLSEAKFGSVNRVFIVCEEDEVMESEFQEMMIESFPPKAVNSIKGGGHMVMISEPSQLFKHLVEVADSFVSAN